MCTNPRKILVTKKGETKAEEITVNCGECPTCLKQRARDWTIKLINEAKYHKEASFITLTFDNAILADVNSKAVKKYGAKPNFPYNVSYSKKYFQKFIKRLRAKFPNKIITYYHLAEYGERNGRAHHHVLLFGCDFREDAKQVELSKSGKQQYYSDTLNELWACGRTRIQYVNDYNIAYIAGYNAKKFNFTDKSKPPKDREKYEKWFQKRKQLQMQKKPIQSFSNRSKMSVKWIRKRPEMLRDHEFLTDKDGKKYSFPKSYIREIKKECERHYGERQGYTTNPVFIQSYGAYDDRRENFIYENQDNFKFLQYQEKIKEKIAEIRNGKIIRDF